LFLEIQYNPKRHSEHWDNHPKMLMVCWWFRH